MTYKTKQKDKILSIIESRKQEFTIKDIYFLVGDGTGLTTIYRLVDTMVNEGSLRKYISKDGTTYYQYLEKCDNNNHFYLKCEKCGSLIHTDCDCIKDLWEHIYKKHKFRPNNEQFIINGICDKCSNKCKEVM